jgi:hypothetical protein
VNTKSKSTCRESCRAHRTASRCASTRGFWQYVGACLAITAAISLAGLLLFRPAAAEAQQPESSVRDNPAMVQAVFLYSIGRYVEWPENTFAKPSSPFVIGILGDEHFGGALDAIAVKKTIQNRKIEIRRYPSLEKYDQECQILYVSHSVPAAEQAAVIEKTKGKPVFVVGATAGLASQGATADFTTDEDRIVIEINAEAARSSQLRMDAKLLSLAKVVGGSPASANN